MTARDTGGPAFPHANPAFDNNWDKRSQIDGMTLRDYFAAKAMAAIVSKIPFQEFSEDFSPYKKAAIGAYDYADAMLEARK